MNSNLPPGVTDSMIPGNRTDDWEWDEFWDQIDADCSKYGIDIIEARRLWAMAVLHHVEDVLKKKADNYKCTTELLGWKTMTYAAIRAATQVMLDKHGTRPITLGIGVVLDDEERADNLAWDLEILVDNTIDPYAWYIQDARMNKVGCGIVKEYDR